MSEVRAWQTLNNTLRGKWTARRLTDRLADGVPDVLWTAERVTALWELKFSAKARGPLAWSSPAQPLWLWEWERGGGSCAVVCRGGGEWWLWVPRPEPGWVAWAKTPEVWGRPDVRTSDPVELLRYNIDRARARA